MSLACPIDFENNALSQANLFKGRPKPLKVGASQMSTTEQKCNLQLYLSIKIQQFIQTCCLHSSYQISKESIKYQNFFVKIQSLQQNLKMIFIWIKFVAFVYFIENSIKVTKSINDQSKIKFYLKDKPNYLLLFINSKVYEICTIFHKFYREKLFFILQK